MSDKSLKGEIVLSSGEETANLPAIPMPVLEALHHTVTGAKETFAVERRMAALVQLPDISQLEHLLMQWAEPFSPISNTIQYIVSNSSNDNINGRSRTKYGSLDSLVRHEVGRTDPISSIQISFSILVRNEEQGRLDTLDATIDISGDTPQYVYAVNEDDPLGLSGRARHDDEDVTLYIRTRYTNYVMAKGFVSMVEDWYRNLRQRDVWLPAPKMKFLYMDQAYDPFGPTWIFLKIFPLLTVSLVGMGLSRFIDASILEDPRMLGLFFCLAIVLFAMVDAAFRLPIRWTSRLSDSARVPLIEINSGDTARAEKYSKIVNKRRDTERIVLRSVALAFIVSVVAGLLVNLI